MDFGPLPESSFIANVRDTIPIGKVTTTMTRGKEIILSMDDTMKIKLNMDDTIKKCEHRQIE